MDDPGVRVTWCDVDNGVEFGSHRALRVILNWLYDAFLVIGLESAHKELYIRLPSGVSWCIILNYELVDFRIPEKRYWGVKFWISGVEFPTVPLPKIEFDEDFIRNLLAPLNISVDGSEDWLYWDSVNDEYKVGTEFTPERTYHILSDGSKDVGFMALIMAITYALMQVNLIKVATEFIKKALFYYNKFKEFKMRKTVSDIYQEISMEDRNLDVDDMYTLIESLGLSIDDIKGLIGLRFRL